MLSVGKIFTNMKIIPQRSYHISYQIMKICHKDLHRCPCLHVCEFGPVLNLYIKSRLYLHTQTERAS